MREDRSPFRLRGAAVAAAFLATAGLAGPLAADQWRTVNSESTSVLIEKPTRLRQLDPVLQQLFLPDANEDLKLTSTIQLFPVDPNLLGINRARGRARATVQCFGQSQQRNLGTVNKKFDREGNLGFSMEIPADLDCEFVGLEWHFLKRFLLPEGNSIQIDSAIELVDGSRARNSCFDVKNLCLNDDRFQVEVGWRDFQGQQGQALAFPRTDDSGTFFFFDPGNTELLLKVLDGCSYNGHYWLFAAAVTDVEFTITVTDTQRNQSRVYDNPLGRPAPAIVDTSAFATCP